MNAKQIAERLREQAAYVELLHPLDISPEDVAARYREAADLLEHMALRPTIADLVRDQYAWLQSVGWTRQTALEDLALVCSEVGEAVNECRGDTPTDEFKTELADIVLRVVGIAGKNGIDLESAILAKMEINRQRGTRGRIK